METRMFDLPGIFGTLANLIVVIIGFGLIVFVHELGHFVAAKWAGIRVLAFSMGMGPVLLSYRKGLGFRKGSSEHEYFESLHAGAAGRDPSESPISPTEYRFSALPLGGYVKMLGQEDLNPGAVSSSPDSYQNCAIPKRLVVISAGVVVNVVTAALLFIAVFMIGLQSNPAQIGAIDDNSPATRAVAIDRDDVAVGLQPGDVITQINNSKIYGFRDISSTIAMAPKSSPSRLSIARDGYDEPIQFEVSPEKNAGSGFLDIGVLPTSSNQIFREADPEAWSQILGMLGGLQLQLGDRLIAVNGIPADGPYDLIDAAKNSNGNPFPISLENDGQQRTLSVHPIAELQEELVEIDDSVYPVEHILGLTGLLRVHPDSSPDDTKQGLAPGDVFIRLGNIAYPSEPEGIRVIRAHTGEELEIELLREGEIIKLKVQVSSAGTVGFLPSSTIDSSNLLASPVFGDADHPASRIINRPGTQLRSIGDEQITTIRDAQPIIVRTTQEAFDRGDETFEIPVTLVLPLPTQPDGSEPVVTENWILMRAEIEQLRSLGWTMHGEWIIASLFEPVTVIDRSPNPIAAVRRGLHESKRVMISVYLTFVRLYQGSVQVKHLKGPVGIAHLGTQIADQGFMMLLFFMAMISINLAVINFLPLPIVDGGQFLMLLYEWVRGKPLPIPVQNVVTLAGILLIGIAFLYITFQDITALFGG